MADSSTLMLKVKEVLESPSIERLENYVNQLFKRHDSDEFQSASALYKFFAEKFPDGLALKLLEVYLSSSSRIVRFRSIYILYESLNGFQERGYEFSLVTLNEIKPLLISCLEMQETQEAEMKLFRRIVSCIALDVVIFDNDGWNELSECILSLTDTDPLKAFNVFVDLPLYNDGFISGFKDNILEQAFKVLQDPEEDEGVQDWSLALQTALKMGVHQSGSDLADEILSNLVKVASELMEEGMEEFLVEGLETLETFLLRDKNLYNYNTNQCFFVKDFLVRIKGLGIEVKDAVEKIIQSFQGNYNSDIQQQDHGAYMGRLWYYHIKSLSPLELLGIVASTDVLVMYRQMAIMVLNGLLSDHSEGEVNPSLDISVMTSLQPVLISCLKEEGLPDKMFKILCQVVNHVAEEMVKSEDGKWDGLRDYFASESKNDFRRAVKVFQCLRMSVEEEFLLPEISTRLKLPEDLLVDNSDWVLAFTGAFSAIIKLIEIKDHGDQYIKSTAGQMVSSVEYLVKRGMEDRYVRKAFSELESLVKNQLGWYTSTVYKFVKGLLWSFYQIKGMEWESKLVVWRINVRVEKGVDKQLKEMVNPEYDWLNQPMPEDDEDLDDGV